MPYHIDEENSELAFEVREGNKLVIKIKSNIFSDSLELYLIKVGDNTEPTDKNVFSSLRVLKEIENLHDTILKEINSVTSGFWELKQDSQGNEYIATKYNVLTEGGLTTYGLGEQKLGTIYDGLPIDNNTIYWEEVEGSRVLKAKGSGGGSTGLDETKLWNVLGTPGDQQIDYSHLRSAFSQFSNEFVTINTEQEITALKHFTAGLSIGSAKKKIYEKDGVLYIDSNVAITGALTMYATDGQSVSSIYDGLPIDNDTIYWEVVDGSKVLKAKGSGGEAGSVQWGNISGKPTWIEDTKPTYNWYEIQGEKPFYTKEEVAAKFVTIDTEQEITALKHFTAGLSVGESKKKIYEENGVVYIDADVAVTGAMTFYATAGRTVSTIMDAVAVDGITITKEGNVLKAVSGSGSNFDKSAMWTALAGSTTEQINKSHLTTALTGYATESWVSEKNYAVEATTLTGYGITDGINDVSVTGTGNAITSASISGHSLTLTKGSTFLLSSQYTAADILAKLKTVDGAGSDLEADILALTGETGSSTGDSLPTHVGLQVFQYYNSGNGPHTLGNFLRIRGNNGGCGELFLGWNADNTTSNIWYKSKRDVGLWGPWRQVAFTDMNVASATKLQTARTLWGQSFDGTGDVTGQIVANNGIYLPYGGKIVNEYGNILRTNYDSASGYNDYFEITAIGSNKIGKSLTGGNSGLLTWGGNRFIFNSYGVGWYAEDGEWMRTYNSLYVPKNVQCKGNIECDNKVICSTLQAKELDIAYGTNYKFVRMSWNGTSGDVASFFVPGSTSQWFTMELRSNGVLYTNGNILAEGGGTYYGSDIRYKSIMQQVELSLLSIANAPSFVYRWNKKGMKRDRLNLGGSAQYTQSILPWAVEENDNFLSMDYATVAYTFAVHTARHLLTYETRTDKKIKKLEREIVILKNNLKS